MSNKLQKFGGPIRHAFFLLNFFIKIAVQTCPSFVSKATLSTSSTKCACNRPTNSTAALSGVNSVIGGIGSCRTYSKLRHFVSLWVSPAIHIFPAILSVFCHVYRILFEVKICHRGRRFCNYILIMKIFWTIKTWADSLNSDKIITYLFQMKKRLDSGGKRDAG